MKVLCLHGRGSNNDIFRLQTASLRALLPGYDFSFVQGTHVHHSGNWSLYTTSVTSQPLYTYNDPLSPNSIRDTQNDLLDLIRETGPFDGLIGYSGGAALAAEVMIRHKIESQKIDEWQRTDLFNWAVFINGASPLKVFRLDEIEIMENASVDVHTLLMEEGGGLVITNSALRSEGEGLTEEKLVETRQKLLENLEGKIMLDGTRFLCSGNYGITRYVVSSGEEPLIDVPTLHIRSPIETDQHYGFGLSQLCAQETRHEYLHTSGHDFPRGRNEIFGIAKAIQELVEQA